MAPRDRGGYKSVGVVLFQITPATIREGWRDSIVAKMDQPLLNWRECFFVLIVVRACSMSIQVAKVIKATH